MRNRRPSRSSRRFARLKGRGSFPGFGRADADAVAALLRPIVLGQIRSFRNDHPRALDATMAGGLARRIIHDIASRGNLPRIRAAFGIGAEAAGEPRVVSNHCDARGGGSVAGALRDQPAGVGTIGVAPAGAANLYRKDIEQ